MLWERKLPGVEMTDRKTTMGCITRKHYSRSRNYQNGQRPKEICTEQICTGARLQNLFNVDGGQFVSQGDKNLTWTILALSLRTSEYIVDH